MSSKQLMFKDAALTEMKRGVDRLAEAVKCTMGPSGRHVVIEKSYGGPQVTKDGVTVAKEVSPPEPFQAMGAKMVNDVAKRTADKAGDDSAAAGDSAGPEDSAPADDSAAIDPFCVDQPVVTWANFGAGFVLEACQGCHASTTPFAQTLSWGEYRLEIATPGMTPVSH